MVRVISSNLSGHGIDGSPPAVKVIVIVPVFPIGGVYVGVSELEGLKLPPIPPSLQEYPK